MSEIQITKKKILVVDDEALVRRSLVGILSDEGYEVLEASDGDEAITLLESLTPDLLLLDIWLPGIDGIDVLKNVRQRWPAIPVIMISGHATISSAVEATRLGAVDFIEKPLELTTTLAKIASAFKVEIKAEKKHTPRKSNIEKLAKSEILISDVVFEKQSCRGKNYGQRTLKSSAVLYGQGLHSGKKSGLIFEPLGSNAGIHFVGLGEKNAVPAHVDYVDSTGFATTIRLGTVHAATVEHIMSALHAYKISNLLIKCNGEVPVMDGSSLEFCNLFEEIGVEEQEGDWFSIKLDQTLKIGDEKEWLQLEPGDGFTIDYTLEYGAPIGKQNFVFTLDSIHNYRANIAPARTFGFVNDIGYLQKNGLALGGRFDNFVLIGEDGPINGDLRFPDEFARHKILDAVGDLYLLGRPIEGKLTARMTGHSDNIDLLKKIRDLIEI